MRLARACGLRQRGFFSPEAYGTLTAYCQYLVQKHSSTQSSSVDWKNAVSCILAPDTILAGYLPMMESDSTPVMESDSTPDLVGQGLEAVASRDPARLLPPGDGPTLPPILMTDDERHTLYPTLHLFDDGQIKTTMSGKGQQKKNKAQKNTPRVDSSRSSRRNYRKRAATLGLRAPVPAAIIHKHSMPATENMGPIHVNLALFKLPRKEDEMYSLKTLAIKLTTMGIQDEHKAQGGFQCFMGVDDTRPDMDNEMNSTRMTLCDHSGVLNYIVILDKKWITPNGDYAVLHTRHINVGTIITVSATINTRRRIPKDDLNE